MAKRASNKKAKQIMDDTAFANWQVDRKVLTNEIINAWREFKEGYQGQFVEVKFVSLTANQLKGIKND